MKAETSGVSSVLTVPLLISCLSLAATNSHVKNERATAEIST